MTDSVVSDTWTSSKEPWLGGLRNVTVSRRGSVAFVTSKLLFYTMAP